MISIILVDIGLIWLATLRPITIGTFVIGLAVLFSLGLLALLGYWLYGLTSSGYFLDRNSLVIHWGTMEQTIPTRQIERVLTGDEIEGHIAFYGGMWPGHCVGYGEVPGAGPTLFNATVPPRHQIYIVTPSPPMASRRQIPRAFSSRSINECRWAPRKSWNSRPNGRVSWTGPSGKTGWGWRCWRSASWRSWP
jgi:hypothetical protein